ncbi:motility associated factor glycosyltransferase family protein [Gracilibacillus phocaeensis]|uniref:motility associated factor glycosyltransferase family protein n=1 Tax=Gracilibacillus phocaeensis TaxID=2042304 RepID=UPI001031FAAA|nr:6-hydroxymethylpterin diphosphokinase MptE-like protein [Gracilibacillus phocaeensis]
MLIDNKNYLSVKNRPLLQLLNETTTDEEFVEIEMAKSEQLTLKIKQNDSYKYVHSKYNPLIEIDKLVNQFDLIEGKSHILLFGLGMGYHYTALKKKFPHATFSIYEPDLLVLKKLLSHISLEELFGKDNVTIVVKETMESSIQHFLQSHQNKIEVFALPYYQKNYQVELDKLYALLVDQLKNTKSRLVTNLSFQKRWTINAIKNFPTVLKTPNILRDIDESVFKGKPAIIVSAGPSLNEEFENLKYIKKHGLAYIFSVGSAINALIENDILPDAICTYDPQAHNYKVIQKVKDRNIATIPLIFGSTVGYETLFDYQGPLLHMITTQDTIAPYLLQDEKEIDMVNDAPSIALVTYQLLSKLKVKTIYLVGQNLSFKDRYRYAAGVEYQTDQVSEDKLIPVKSVSGKTVWTEDGYNRMRQTLELYIKQTTSVNVYNTTKDGAAIEGASFIPLSKVINTHFTNQFEVSDQWYHAEPHYERNHILDHMNNLAYYKNIFMQDLTDTMKMMRHIYQSKHHYRGNNGKLEKQLAKFDKKFKKIKKNRFNQTFLSPMLRVQLENLVASSQEIKQETDNMKKIDLFYNRFGSFLSQLNHLMHEVNEYFEELRNNELFVEKEVSK